MSLIIIAIDPTRYPLVVQDLELYLSDKPEIEVIEVEGKDEELIQQILTEFHSQEVGRMNYPKHRGW